MRIRTVGTFFFIVILFFSNSCDAPRNNPLDPENGDKNIGVIEGLIQSVSLPRKPIEGASIFWSDKNIFAETNQSGIFKIENVIPNDDWLIFDKTGYSADSFFVKWNNQKNININVFLNATPKLDSMLFSSIVVNKFPSNQKYSIEIKAKISDEENDVDSVFLENSNLNITKRLDYNLSSKYYERTLFLPDLNIVSLDEIIGIDFEVIALDVSHKRFSVGLTNLKRIIKEEVLLTAPSGRETIRTDSILFKWNRFTPGFTFFYIIQIYTDETPPELIWEETLDKDLIDYLYVPELQAGEYFWVMWAVDEFSNKTRSKPASFVIN